MSTKILIMKLGYSETLDSEIARIPSLGDVLRTTPILWALKEKYPDSRITWLVDRQAEPLLRGNHLIDRLLIWDEFVPFQLMKERFDVLINLEKIAGVCALSDMIDAWVKYGFRFDGINGTYHAYERGLDFIDYIKKKHTGKSRDCWQKILIQMMGAEWKAQEYIIGYKPQQGKIFDAGLNYIVGSKWPHKAMPVEKWKELEKKLVGNGYKVSWQQGVDDLYKYMDWINSCRIIVSNDSLGLHIAFALKKKVIGLFGPTDSKEIYFYGNSKVVRAHEKCRFMPCYKLECISGMKCMEKININDVINNVDSLYKNTK
jgi:heptosyltransferase-2